VQTFHFSNSFWLVLPLHLREMVVRLRLARPPGHTRKTTHFNLVAVDIRKRRDAKPIEIVGVYDPVPHQVKRPQPLGAPPVLSREPEKLEKRIEWSVGRIRYWLSVGAQPSETVASLLRKVSSYFDSLIIRSSYRFH
jgi:small subunit ribosomal protein S16